MKNNCLMFGCCSFDQTKAKKQGKETKLFRGNNLSSKKGREKQNKQNKEGLMAK